MNKIISLFFINFFLATPLWSTGQKLSDSGIRDSYQALLECKVQIYRITRDKAYEIYFPDFELIETDLADVVNTMEENFALLDKILQKSEYKQDYNNLMNVWNNIRFYTLVKPTKKSFNRYFFDAKTFESLINTVLKKMEDREGTGKIPGTDMRKLYRFRSCIYLINTGYLINKHPINKSLATLFEKELNKAENLLAYAKERGYFKMNRKPVLLAKMLNNWKYYKYNLHNPLFRADKLVFSLANTLNYESYKLNILIR